MMEITPLLLGDVFTSFDAFVAANVMLFLGMGAMGGRSMTLGAYGGYLAFAWIAINSDSTLYTNIFYVTLTLIFIGWAFKLVRLEGVGGE